MVGVPVDTTPRYGRRTPPERLDQPFEAPAEVGVEVGPGRVADHVGDPRPALELDDPELPHAAERGRVDRRHRRERLARADVAVQLVLVLPPVDEGDREAGVVRDREGRAVAAVVDRREDLLARRRG